MLDTVTSLLWQFLFTELSKALFSPDFRLCAECTGAIYRISIRHGEIKCYGDRGKFTAAKGVNFSAPPQSNQRYFRFPQEDDSLVF